MANYIVNLDFYFKKDKFHILFIEFEVHYGFYDGSLLVHCWFTVGSLLVHYGFAACGVAVGACHRTSTGSESAALHLGWVKQRSLLVLGDTTA